MFKICHGLIRFFVTIVTERTVTKKIVTNLENKPKNKEYDIHK